MALSVLNEYKAITSEQVEKIICSASLAAAAAALETGTTVLDQISILRKSVSVEVPDTDVRFNVSVYPEAAKTAGCIALPQTFVVPAGKEVILQAVLAGGYTFLGWFRGLVSLSTELIAPITVQAPASGQVADEIVAKFQLTP